MADVQRPETEEATLTEETTSRKRSQKSPDTPGGSGMSRWRPRLVLGAIVVGTVLLLVVLPGYLASKPAFFDRYPGLSSQYEPWSASTHVQASCQDCHVPPGVISQVGYGARMVGEFYVSLVWRSREPSVFETPTNAACLSCHDDLRSVSPEGDLRIPHRAHVTILEMECVECHNFLVHETNPKGEYLPPMSGCLRCHDGDIAKDTCTACHTEKSVPDGHLADDWTVVHASKADDPECVDCHAWTENWCADCHTRRPASHVDDWRAVHGDRVEEHRGCEACHEGPFCVRCHGEVPQLNLDPTLELVQ